jgi:hypothetical protein
MKPNCGCSYTPPGAQPAPTTTQVQQCPSTSTASAAPCKAPSYSRACLRGDPTRSPLYIERKGREEHLWTRAVSVIWNAAAGNATYFDVVYPAFTSSGSACLKSVSLITNTVALPNITVPVDIVGIAGVWDFTDATPNWTERVAIPCEKETIGIITTASRCPCEVECEGCLYPEALGGSFMVRYKFASTTFTTGMEIRFTATGHHDPTPPCCVLPVHLEEEAALGDNIVGILGSSGEGYVQKFG